MFLIIEILALTSLSVEILTIVKQLNWKCVTIPCHCSMPQFCVCVTVLCHSSASVSLRCSFCHHQELRQSLTFMCGSIVTAPLCQSVSTTCPINYRYPIKRCLQIYRPIHCNQIVKLQPIKSLLLIAPVLTMTFQVSRIHTDKHQSYRHWPVPATPLYVGHSVLTPEIINHWWMLLLSNVTADYVSSQN